jgi:hypothetical protein
MEVKGGPKKKTPKGSALTSSGAEITAPED